MFAMRSRLRTGWRFLWRHKEYWLSPVVLMIVVFVLVGFLFKGTVSLPLRYRLF